MPHLSPFDENVNDKVLKLDTEMTLLFGELHTDRWLNNKPDILPSPTYISLYMIISFIEDFVNEILFFF